MINELTKLVSQVCSLLSRNPFTLPAGTRTVVALTGWETRQRLLFCTLEKTLLGTRQEVELLRMTSFSTRCSMSWKTLCFTSSCSNTHSWKTNREKLHTYRSIVGTSKSVSPYLSLGRAPDTHHSEDENFSHHNNK